MYIDPYGSKNILLIVVFVVLEWGWSGWYHCKRVGNWNVQNKKLFRKNNYKGVYISIETRGSERILSFGLFKELQSWPFSCLHVHFLVPFAYWNILRAKKNIHIQMNLRRPDKGASHGGAAAAPLPPGRPLLHWKEALSGRLPLQAHYLLCRPRYSLGLWILCSGEPNLQVVSPAIFRPFVVPFWKVKGRLGAEQPALLEGDSTFSTHDNLHYQFLPLGGFCTSVCL